MSAESQEGSNQALIGGEDGEMGEKNNNNEPVKQQEAAESQQTLSRRTFLKVGAAGAAAAGAVGLAVKAQAFDNSSSTAGSSTQLVQQTADPFASRTITLNVNNQNYTTQVQPRAMLADVLRVNLGLIGTKRPCNRMECGGCTVVMDGKTYYSCTYLAVRAQGKKILTVEGRNVDPVIKTLQDAWVPNDASQCGYCQPGRIMAATALLKQNPNPTRQDVVTAISGNLCRCGTYINVVQAILDAAKSMSA